MPTIYTSNFSRVKLLPAEVVPVSIARWPPRTWKGARCIDLAPPVELLRAVKTGKIPIAEYTERYRAHLAKLDPKAVAAKLPPSAGLLCFCPPGFYCHRRFAAEWLEAALGAEIPEYGIGREMLVPAAAAPCTDWTADMLPWRTKCDHCKKSVPSKLGDPSMLCPACGKTFQLEWDRPA